MQSLPRIRTPFRRRWREFRFRYLPLLIFAGVSLCAIAVWKKWVVPTDLAGCRTKGAENQAAAGRETSDKTTNSIAEVELPPALFSTPGSNGTTHN